MVEVGAGMVNSLAFRQLLKNRNAIVGYLCMFNWAGGGRRRVVPPLIFG